MSRLVILAAPVLRYRADKQTNTQTSVKTVTLRQPPAWVISYSNASS